jgi:hypothetical protein
MYPAHARDDTIERFYPPDERIAAETERNHEAVLYLLERAACPYAAIGGAAAWCGPLYDDLEIDRGWRVDAAGTDDASAGAWVRGTPKGDAWQLAGAVSGRAVLVTGRARDVDVDGGRTSVRSPTFTLPEGRPATLRLRYWVGLDAAAGPEDGFAVRLVAADGTPLAGVLSVTGDGAPHAARWRNLVVAIDEAWLVPGDRRLAIELEARDTGADGTVEAAIDSPRVTLG